MLFYFQKRGEMRLSFSFLALFGLSAVQGAGLEARDERFFLDGEEIRLLSGSIHYFRVPHEYWMDRLLKLKASGMNMVETYVAWNLHEPYEGPGFSDFLVRPSYDLGTVHHRVGQILKPR